MNRLLIRMALVAGLVMSLAGCPWNTKPNVPETVTVTVTDYRDLPDWIKPVPVYQRSGSRVNDHLNAECRHKVAQEIANCRITAAQRIVGGQKVEPEACELKQQCEDKP